jgi:protein-tyrosine phosphatase
MVCLGNICRSPAAMVVMQHLVAEAGLADRVVVESAGTGAWHVGDLADHRTRAEARARNYDLEHRARQFRSDDFDDYDLVVAMDAENARDLRRLARDDDACAKIVLLRSFDPASPTDHEVPDPYYGDQSDFAEVFDLVEPACHALLDHVVAHEL